MSFTVDALPERLRTKVRVNPATGCWEWIGSVTATGYGRAWDSTLGRSDWAHRVVYRALIGPIPNGMVLDHLCRVRHCVNPSMLDVVTTQINTARSTNPAVTRARHRSKDECLRGHPLTEADRRPDGRRHCAECARTHQATYRARNLDRIRAHDRERKRADVLLELAILPSLSRRGSGAVTPRRAEILRRYIVTGNPKASGVSGSRLRRIIRETCAELACPETELALYVAPRPVRPPRRSALPSMVSLWGFRSNTLPNS